MTRTATILHLAAATFVSGISHCQGQSAGAILPAFEMLFATEPNKTYDIESSLTLSEWGPESGRIYGDGTPRSLLFEMEAGVSGKYFRMRTQVQPQDGRAPWSPAGLRFLLNSDGNVESITLTSPIGGFRQRPGEPPQAFACTSLKAGPDKFQITILPGTADVIEICLNYASGEGGTFTWACRSEGCLDQDSGSFIQEQAASTDPFAPFTSPEDVASHWILLKDAAGVLQVNLDSASAATITTGRNETLPASVIYTKTGDTTAVLDVSYSTTRREIYNIALTHGKGGTFVRQSWRQTSLLDTDEGSFSWVPPPDSPGGGD